MNNQQHIIEEIRQGNEKPLIEIYELYRNEYIVWASKTYKIDSELAKDTFQDAVISFRNNILSGELKLLTSSIKTYIFQIGKFKIINSIKKNSKLTYVSNFQLTNQKDYEEYMEKENDYSLEQIKIALEKLPDDCQKLLKLHYFNEYDMESIARELNLKNADTAKSKKSICMKKLISELKKLTMLFMF